MASMATVVGIVAMHHAEASAAVGAAVAAVAAAGMPTDDAPPPPPPPPPISAPVLRSVTLANVDGGSTPSTPAVSSTPLDDSKKAIPAPIAACTSTCTTTSHELRMPETTPDSPGRSRARWMCCRPILLRPPARISGHAL